MLLSTLSTESATLKIDAGFLFYDDTLSGQPQRLSQARIAATAIVEAYNHMGYDAVAIGGDDLAAGLKTLQALAAQADFPLLSANLINEKGVQILPATASLERAGMRIAIIGLSGPGSHGEMPDGAFRLLPWQEVLPPLAKESSRHHDLVILLSSLSSPDNAEIAAQLPEIHIIIQAGGSNQNRPPELLNNSLLCQLSHDGRYQGHLTVTWTANRQWQSGENPRLALQKEYDRLGWLINRITQKGGPQVVYQGNSARQQAFAEDLARYRQLEVELSLREQDAPPPAATFSHLFHPLPPSLGDDPTIVKILQEARKKANQIRRQNTGSTTLSHYAGSSSCQGCHTEIYLAWSRTPHARAHQTLEARDQNNNLNCVYCHVTGLNKATAHLATSLPPSLAAVGCEACHGPAQKHVASPEQSPPPSRPNAALCLQCHTAERDDDFNYQRDKNSLHPTPP